MKSTGLLAVLSALFVSSSVLAGTGLYIELKDPTAYNELAARFHHGSPALISELQGNWELEQFIDKYNYVPHREGEIVESSIQPYPNLHYSVPTTYRLKIKTGYRALPIEPKTAPVLKIQRSQVNFSDWSGAGRNLPNRLILSGDGKWIGYKFVRTSTGSTETTDGQCVIDAESSNVLLCRQIRKGSDIYAKVNDGVAYSIYKRANY